MYVKYLAIYLSWCYASCGWLDNYYTSIINTHSSDLKANKNMTVHKDSVHSQVLIAHAFIIYKHKPATEGTNISSIMASYCHISILCLQHLTKLVLHVFYVLLLIITMLIVFLKIKINAKMAEQVSGADQCRSASHVKHFTYILKVKRIANGTCTVMNENIQRQCKGVLLVIYINKLISNISKAIL